jgi:hypothetical protein
MNAKFIVIGLMIVLSAVLILTACGQKAAAKAEIPLAAAGQKVVYTCPMHPEVISDKPGKCPKCGMNLVLKK